VIALGLAYLGAMRESVPTGVSRYGFGGGQRTLPSARRGSYVFGRRA